MPNAINTWMRSQSWYQQILSQNGGNARSDQAKAAIVKAAQQHGIQVDHADKRLASDHSRRRVFPGEASPVAPLGQASEARSWNGRRDSELVSSIVCCVIRYVE